MAFKFPITDTHVHFLNHDRFNYQWTQNISELNKFYGPEELNTSSALMLDSIIFVQCECEPEQALDEVKWVTALAKKETKIKGIVAYAPLHDTSAPQFLEKLNAFPLVKGVRRLIEPEKDIHFCLNPIFISNIKLLSELNLTFDICIKSHQFPAVIQLVQQCSETQFILDHLGKPNIAQKEQAPWKNYFSEIASFPNVSCKLSGLLSEAEKNASSNDFEFYVMHAIELFQDRLMFGSDWPVVNLNGSYMQWIETLETILKRLPESQLRRIFHETAHQIYRLPSEKRAP
jgi:L-fuconolactonase